MPEKYDGDLNQDLMMALWASKINRDAKQGLVMGRDLRLPALYFIPHDIRIIFTPWCKSISLYNKRWKAEAGYGYKTNKGFPWLSYLCGYDTLTTGGDKGQLVLSATKPPGPIQYLELVIDIKSSKPGILKIV